MAIRVALRNPRNGGKDHLHQIQVIYSFTHPVSGKTVKKIVGTKYRIKKSDFNPDGRRYVGDKVINPTARWVRKSHGLCKKINDEIEKTILNLNESEEDVKEKHGVVTPNTIARSYLMKAVSYTPVELFEKYMEHAKQKKKSESTYKMRRATLHTLLRYEDVFDTKLEFDSFNAHFGEQYVYGLAKGVISTFNKPMAHKTIYTYMVVLGGFLKWARKKFGIWDNEKDWVMALEFAEELERESKEPVPLYREEVEAIYGVPDKNLSKNEQLARDVFILASETGRRVGEVKSIRIADINQAMIEGKECWYINFVAHKNKKQIQVLLSDRALGIVRKYYQDGNELLFVRLQRTKHFNKELRSVAKTAGLNRPVMQTINAGLEKSRIELPLYECLSFHDGRHTWSNENLMEGMPIELVSKMLTHSDIKTTGIYSQRLPGMILRQQYDARVKQEQQHDLSEDEIKAQIEKLTLLLAQKASTG